MARHLTWDERRPGLDEMRPWCLHLRGILARIVERGVVAVGDTAAKS
jgi:hypothetical protein